MDHSGLSKAAVIATAVLDRLLHHSHVLNIRGESYRLKEKRQSGLLGAGHHAFPTMVTIPSGSMETETNEVGQN